MIDFYQSNELRFYFTNGETFSLYDVNEERYTEIRDTYFKHHTFALTDDEKHETVINAHNVTHIKYFRSESK